MVDRGREQDGRWGGDGNRGRTGTEQTLETLESSRYWLDLCVCTLTSSLSKTSGGEGAIIICKVL